MFHEKFSWLSRALIWYSVCSLLCEIWLGFEHSLDAGFWFIWPERLIATFFMCEYISRVYEDYYYPDRTPDIGLGKRYPTSLLGVIDLMAFLPFLVGFFLPNYLYIIRACRVLRLFKLFRYHESLQIVARAFVKSFIQVRGLLFSLLIIIIFNAVLLHEIEYKSELGNPLVSVWYCVITASTIGYGDYTPVTGLGKFVALVFLIIPSLSIFAAIIGVITSNFVIHEDNSA